MAKQLLIKLDAELTDDGAVSARRLTPNGLSHLLSGFKDDEVKHVEIGAYAELTLVLTDAVALIVFGLTVDDRFSVKLANADTAQLTNQRYFVAAADLVSRGILGTGLDVRITGNGTAAANIGVWIARAG